MENKGAQTGGSRIDFYVLKFVDHLNVITVLIPLADAVKFFGLILAELKARVAELKARVAELKARRIFKITCGAKSSSSVQEVNNRYCLETENQEVALSACCLKLMG